MDTGWYIKSESGVKGPFAAAVLKGMAQEGEVVPGTLVRHGTDGNWLSAAHVKGLLGQPQAEPPIVVPPVENVSGSHMAELLREAAEEETVRKRQQERMAELLTEAEREAAYKQQREAESKKDSRLVPCIDCEKPISRLALTCPNCGCPVIVPPRPDKYPALRFIAAVNKFFAIVIPILCLIGLAIIFSLDKVGAAKPEIITPLVFDMIVAPVACWGSAELILLLIEIEGNTSTLREMTLQEAAKRDRARRLLSS